MTTKKSKGTITWTDLTVPDAAKVKDFYRAVLGWAVEEVDMGGYSDYAMTPEEGSPPVAGVCHTRGTNADIPPQWLLYVDVEDLDSSIASCRELGGQVLAGPRSLGEGRFCVIRDPAGAVMAIHEPGGN